MLPPNNLSYGEAPEPKTAFLFGLALGAVVPLLDPQKLFVVNYADGSRAFLRVPHEIAAFGVSLPVMKFVREVQARGEIPAGDTASLVTAR